MCGAPQYNELGLSKYFWQHARHIFWKMRCLLLRTGHHNKDCCHCTASGLTNIGGKLRPGAARPRVGVRRVAGQHLGAPVRHYKTSKHWPHWSRHVAAGCGHHTTQHRLAPRLPQLTSSYLQLPAAAGRTTAGQAPQLARLHTAPASRETRHTETFTRIET